MVKHKELISSVSEQVDVAGADDETEQLREIITAVVSTLAQTLTEDQRRRFSYDLPGTVSDAPMFSGEPQQRDGTEVIAEVAQRLQVTSERARYLAQAVLTGLRDTDPAVADFLNEHVPPEIVAVLTPTGDSAERVASTRAEVPTELSDEELTKALDRLTGWGRDQRGISRTVSLPADRITPLIERVQREAARGNDHARAERNDDGVTFTLGTGDAGVVTEPDVLLAQRIDEAVMDVGSGGRPGR